MKSLQAQPPPTDQLTSLAAWVQDQFEGIADDIHQLVQLETPSNDKALLDKGLAWLQSRSEQLLGSPDDVARYDGGDHGDVLVLTYHGAGERVITFLCHYDTVWDAGALITWAEPPEARNDVDVLSGPGIFDMKSGCVQAIWALASLHAQGLPTPTVRIMFTGDEEIGSGASRQIIERYSLTSDLVMLFEPSEAGRIKTERKGIGRFQLRTTGRAVHSGAHYELGISAIDEMARLTLDLHALTDLAAGTTVNVGVVKGGTRSNVMAAHAEADIDVRVSQVAEMGRIDSVLALLAPHHPEAELELSGGWNRPPMERSPLTVEPYELAAQVAGALGHDLGEIAVGGGSDGNFAVALGIPVLDGMGAVGGNPHADGEFIHLTASIGRIPVAAGVLAAIAGS